MIIDSAFSECCVVLNLQQRNKHDMFASARRQDLTPFALCTACSGLGIPPRGRRLVHLM